MAILTVTNTNDSGEGSLRAAIDAANANVDADTIKFASSLKGETIVLQTTLTITQGTVTIDGDLDGDGDPDIFISGDKNPNGNADVGDLDLLIQNNGPATLTLRSLSLGHAYAGPTLGSSYAGVINNGGTLSVYDSVFKDMKAVGSVTFLSAGEGAYAGISGFGTINLTDTMMTGLYASGGLGGDSSDGGNAVAGVVMRSGQLTATRLHVDDSTASGGRGGDYASSVDGGDGGDATVGILLSGGTLNGSLVQSGNSRSNGAGGLGDNTFYGVDGSSGSGVVGVQNAGGTNNATTYSVTGSTDGDDILSTSGGILIGGLGDDELTDDTGGSRLWGQFGDDTLINKGDNARVYGASGNDTVKVLEFGNGAIFDGGSGVDTLDARNADPFNIGIDLLAGTGTNYSGNTFSVLNIENFYGVDDGALGADRAYGTNGKNILKGFAGSDILEGRGGNDLIDGGSGADTLRGGDGNDTIIGGSGGNDHAFGGNNNDKITLGGNSFGYGEAGNDTIIATYFSGMHVDGGAGIDTLDVSKDSGVSVTFDLIKGTSAYGNILNFENMTGMNDKANKDTILGTNGKNILKGLAGNDTLNGRGGDDDLQGGAGNDNIIGGGGKDKAKGGGGNDTAKGGSGNDTLNGQAGKDKLVGEAGNDKMIGGGGNDNMIGGGGKDTSNGGNGNDTINGGKGADTSTGGKGKDTFVFKSQKDSGTTKKTQDKIGDFDDKGNDVIDLKGFKGTLTYLGTGALTGKNQVHVEKQGKHVLVEVSTDKDAAAEFSLLLLNTKIGAMGADDFVL